MKTIDNFITEKLNNKYLVIYYKRGRKAMYTNDYTHVINTLKPDWYEVYNAEKQGDSKIDSLIEFSGNNSDVYKAIEKSENSSNPELKQSDIAKLKSKFKY